MLSGFQVIQTRSSAGGTESALTSLINVSMRDTLTPIKSADLGAMK